VKKFLQDRRGSNERKKDRRMIAKGPKKRRRGKERKEELKERRERSSAI